MFQNAGYCRTLYSPSSSASSSSRSMTTVGVTLMLMLSIGFCRAIDDLSAATATAATEPNLHHLRTKHATTTATAVASVVATEEEHLINHASMAEKDRSNHKRTPSHRIRGSTNTGASWPMPKKMMGKIDKGMECTGGFDSKKMAAAKSCKGGMKKTVQAEFMETDEVLHTIASSMKEMVSDVVASDESSFYPLDSTMEELIEMDHIVMTASSSEHGDDMNGIIKESYHDMLDDEDNNDEFTKTVEFGGTVKAFWGCKVTMSKKGGKFSKTIMCGVKGMEMMGVKPPKEISVDGEDYDLDTTIVFMDESNEEHEL